MSHTVWVPGTGSMYRPSNSITWAEDFERVMREYHEQGHKITRNSLTSELIEMGLKYREMQNNSNLPFLEGEFTEEELSLLQTEAGRKIISNLLRAALRGDGSLPIQQTQTEKTPQNTSGKAESELVSELDSPSNTEEPFKHVPETEEVKSEESLSSSDDEVSAEDEAAALLAQIQYKE